MKNSFVPSHSRLRQTIVLTRKVRASLFAALSVVLMAVSANASVLLSWDFPHDSQINTVSESSTTNDLLIEPGSLTRVGLDAGFYGAVPGWSIGGYEPTLNLSEYISFSVAPTAGNSVTIDSISYRYFANSDGEFQIRSSLDNFASTINTAVVNFGQQQSGFAIVGVVDQTSSVEFRIYGYGAVFTLGNYGSDSVASDDFVVNGTASPVPEPSAFALLCIGLFAVPLFMRYRHNALNVRV